MSEVSQQQQQEGMAAIEQKEAVQDEAPEDEAAQEEAPEKAVNVDDEEMNDTAEEEEAVDEDAANDDEDDEDESDSEDEEDSFTVKILEGKRERTSTARYVPQGKDPNEEEKERKQREEEEFVAGSGTRLADIPFIEWSISKEETKSVQLQLLHRLCFGNRPKGKHRVLTKRQLREFSGFPYGQEDKRFGFRESLLKSQHKSAVLPVARLVGIECTSSTPLVELQQALVDFLLCPQDNGKAVPDKKPKGQQPKKKVKRKSSAKKSSSEAPKKRKSSSKKSESEVVSSEDEDEEEEEKPAKKKTPKKSSAVAEPKKKVKTPKKSPAPTKKKTPVKRKASVSDASSSEDDQPLVKKKKDEPSDDEIKAVIKSILKSANLEEITMKSVCTQVYARYPDHDMQERKDFIKNTVKMIIS